MLLKFAEQFIVLYQEHFDLLSALEDELRFVFITSQATLHAETKRPENATKTTIEGLWIEVKSSEHPKCERCWHRRAEVNQHVEYPGICHRCIENISGDGEHRMYA